MSTVEDVRSTPVAPTPVTLGGVRGGPDSARTLRTRPLVAEPRDHSGDPHLLRRLLDLGGLSEPQLLRRGRRPPQSDLAVLFTLPRRELRSGQPPRIHPGPVDHLARHLDPHRPARIQAHLLLLPPRVLPGLLAVTSCVRRGRRARDVLGREPLPADPAERRTATSSISAWS